MDGLDRQETSKVATRAFSTLGVELDRLPDEPVYARWRTDGRWSGWTELEVEVDEGPDRASSEHRDEIVTSPVWIGRADAYQINVPGASTDGDVEALLVRADRGVTVDLGTTDAAGAALNGPSIRSRSAWGARPATGTPVVDDELKLVVVHHSATANGYSAAEVPSILRSIQAFHMDGRGWSDFAYSFVVDRFGRIWEGRGESDRLIRGAHAQGFNTDSVGVMVLGEYGSVEANDAQLEAVADVIAWKFANERVEPTSPVSYTSAGSTTVPAGQTLSLPRIIGHRDVGATACPGQYLYNVLWAIRARVIERGPGYRSPAGAIDPVAFAPAQLRVSGWAADPDTSAPIDVHLYLDGVGYNLGAADLDRPEVAQQHRRLGSRHGFSRTIGGLSPGSHRACLFAINTAVGANTLIGCVDAVIPVGDPLGRVVSVAGLPDGRVGVRGHAVDPDTFDPVAIHVYAGSRGFNLGATSSSSTEAGLEFPLFGGTRAFDATLNGFAPGQHQVCVYAINLGPGANRLIGCSTAVVPSGAPFGSFDQVSGAPDGRVNVAGWSIDPDTASPTDVHVYVGSRGFNLGQAALPRADVGAAYPGYGSNHGFGRVLSGVQPGTHRVCAFGINSGLGSNAVLGCREVEVPGGPPFGSVDALTPLGSGQIAVAGWVIDPDTSGPVETHVYVGPEGRNLGPAAAPRGDVGAAYPPYGAGHGFNAVIGGFGSGPRRVCVYGSNTGSGQNALLACRDLVLP